MSARKCPSPQLLIDLCIGKLPDAEVGAVSDHVEVCPMCRESVEALERIPIPFVEYCLRASASDEVGYATEARLQRVLAIVKQLRAGADSEDPSE